jgi:Bacterial Ig domain
MKRHLILPGLIAVSLTACPSPVDLPDTTAPSVSISTNTKTITANGAIQLTATASDNKGVTRVEFYDGSTRLGEDASSPFALSVNATRSINGAHSFIAKAFDAAGNTAVSTPENVTVNISDTTAPTVSLTGPASVTTAAAMTLSATATDETDGTGIAKVEFYSGSTKIGEDATAPYTFSRSFVPTDNGTYSFTARAVDGAGNLADSSVLTTTVNLPIPDTTAPTVTLTFNKLIYKIGDVGSTNITATDNVGGSGVVRVEMWVNGVKQFEQAGSTYSSSGAIPDQPESAATYVAKAVDGAGNVGESSPLVVILDKTPPTVSLSSSSLNVTAAGNITLTASASDTNGLEKVEFYDGATKLGEDTTAPYTQGVNLTNANNGSRVYTAKAFDRAGNVQTSSAASVTVSIPSAALTSSSTSLSAAAAQPVTLTVTPTGLSNITDVRWYVVTQTGDMRIAPIPPSGGTSTSLTNSFYQSTPKTYPLVAIVTANGVDYRTNTVDITVTP